MQPFLESPLAHRTLRNAEADAFALRRVVRIWLRRCGVVPFLLLGACGFGWFASAGSQPKIDHIDTFLGDRVLLHFDTEAGRKYELQYTETLTNGVPGGPWTNLFVVEAADFSNHYIVVDTGTRRQRFYRLQVNP